ncbi:hypothetical protein EBT16_05620 [bacterium]|nr:hypothetical protein [bacterium]
MKSTLDEWSNMLATKCWQKTLPEIRQISKEYIRQALAQREAQVRAEEREKVAGLVKLVSAIVNNRGSCFIPTTGGDLSMELYNWDEKASVALATYNNNRKG